MDNSVNLVTSFRELSFREFGTICNIIIRILYNNVIHYKLASLLAQDAEKPLVLLI